MEKNVCIIFRCYSSVIRSITLIKFFHFPYFEILYHLKNKGFENLANSETLDLQRFSQARSSSYLVAMTGPPGSGKSMLARRLPGILPDMTRQEALETTEVHSVMGLTSAAQPLIAHRPFRSPHHTMSPVSLVGGGINPTPGEISLAHNG
ncbi:MAG: ATP-binding protein, partial [Clostridia bacterium]|nr:ATP-binding protein [Clostridia bacterium]